MPISTAQALRQSRTYRRQRFAGGGPGPYTKHQPREIFKTCKKVNTYTKTIPNGNQQVEKYFTWAVYFRSPFLYI